MKLLASDFDGTLLVDKKSNKRDSEGIKNLRKKGHKFIISTGRTLLTMEGVIEKYDLEFDYLVLCNGAVILDKNKNVIKNNLVDFEAVKKIVEEFAVSGMAGESAITTNKSEHIRDKGIESLDSQHKKELFNLMFRSEDCLRGEVEKVESYGEDCRRAA